MKAIPANQLLEGLAPAKSQLITAVVTDSRKAGPGCVFVCFPGETFDGHQFAVQAAEQGAEYVVVNHPVQGLPQEKMVLCQSSHKAMVRMAANYRALFHPVMIGVTGSVGKTTTKEFCYAILSAFGPALKTQGNQNNEIGMPNTLFRLEDSTQYAVVEMGMDHLGEIERMSQAARPNAGIITCIGTSHLESLGTRENILQAKLELCAGLPDGAPLVLNADDEYLPCAHLPSRLVPVWFGLNSTLCDVTARDIVETLKGQHFTLVDKAHGEFCAHIPVMGRHNLNDALAAYAAATRLGLDPARAAAALSEYHSTGMRQRMVQHHGVTVIEDCYNASPDSMRAALAMFQNCPAKRRIALLGDMLELGEYTDQAHKEVGELAACSGVDLLIAYGGAAAKRIAISAAAKGLKAMYFDAAPDAAAALAEQVHPGDVVLAKASRGIALENVLELYYNDGAEPEQ